MKEYIEAQQRNLNAAGFTDQNGNSLVVDGIYGAKTEHAQHERDGAASDGGGSGPGGPHTHTFSGVTDPQ